MSTRRGDAHDGDIGIGILPDDLAFDIVPIGQRHHHLARAIHDMAIGQDVAIGSEDNTRPGALAPVGRHRTARRLPPW